MGRVSKTGLAMVLGLVLASTATPVGAQQADARLLRIRSGLPPTAVERIEAQLAGAREQGLPVDPLLDKAVEGLAKGIAEDRIVGAVARLSAELGQARLLLQDGIPPQPADVSAVADALRRGVPEATVRRLAQRAGPQEPLALAVHTVGDLMDRGVPAEQAMAVLEAWRGRGGHAEELRELPAAVERLIRQGVMPGQAAAAVAGAMQRGGGPPGGPPGLSGNGPGQGVGPHQGPPIPPGQGPPSERGHGKAKGKPPGGGPPGG